MSISRHRLAQWPIVLLAGLVLIALAPAASAQDVSIDFEITGDADPGGSVQVTATVSGAAPSAYAWEQVGGPMATLTNATSQTVTVGLPGLAAFKDNLIMVLEEPPLAEEDLPPGVELPEGEFPGGLQNRFQVIGISPFALHEGNAVVLELTVTTPAGAFTEEVEVLANTPFGVTTGLRNVPINETVLLGGKDQDFYDWSLNGPGGTLMDTDTQYPYFTPTASGLYTVQVTDAEAGETVSIEIWGGTWEGVISGQDSEGLPLAASCTGCHNGGIAPDAFTPWRQSGHAMIATDQLNSGNHWRESCFSCHMVGYNPDADNNGVDEQSDFDDFLNSGIINSQDPNNWTTVLANFPNSAQMMNVQCENCHGPQNGGAHFQGEPRYSLATEVCATCHGEPPRHGRSLQWQLSAHANYDLAIEESQSGTCSACHTVNGFLAWLPDLQAGDGSNPSVDVTWTEDEAHPQTCVSCHPPHDVGTISGDETDADMYITGDTPLLAAGFTAIDVGDGAQCMVCHNSRRGLRNDSTWPPSDPDREPHNGAQADVIMGQSAYFVTTGVRGAHSNRDQSGLLENVCVSCHMEATPPPDLLSYNLGGRNHTFAASEDVCGECHGFETGDAITGPIKANMETLEDEILEYYQELFTEQTAGGNAIVVGDTTITDAGTIEELALTGSRGRQALLFTIGGETVGPASIGSITVGGTALTEVASGDVLRAGWNYFLLKLDGSYGVHNPSFAMDILDNTLAVLGGEEIPCEEGPGTICLNDGRFEVSVDWTGFEAGQGGAANVSNLRTDDSGIFYFNNPNNLEFLIKVLDGCSLNNNYWVFFAATTNVQFTVTVTDTDEGVTKTYNNPLGQDADAITDTMAFATCP